MRLLASAFNCPLYTAYCLLLLQLQDKLGIHRFRTAHDRLTRNAVIAQKLAHERIGAGQLMRNDALGDDRRYWSGGLTEDLLACRSDPGPLPARLGTPLDTADLDLD